MDVSKILESVSTKKFRSIALFHIIWSLILLEVWKDGCACCHMLVKHAYTVLNRFYCTALAENFWRNDLNYARELMVIWEESLELLSELP